MTKYNLRLALDSEYTEMKSSIIMLKEKMENIKCIIKIYSIDSMTASYKIKQNLSMSSFIIDIFIRIFM